MVLILLTKVIAFHVKLTLIGLRGLAFSGRSRGSISACACVVSMNTFINFVKRSLEGKNERWSGSLGGSRSFIAIGIGSSALDSGELILLCGVDGRINARAPLGDAISWSYCKRWKSERNSSK